MNSAKTGCKFSLFSVDIDLNFQYIFGCELHEAKLSYELKNIAAIIVINLFIKNVNNILTGKVKTANNVIEKAALTLTYEC